MFARVIVGECRSLRNQDTTLFRLLLKIPKQRLLLMSATLTLNSIIDNKGLALQHWVTAKMKVDIQSYSPNFLLDDYDICEIIGFSIDPREEGEYASFWIDSDNEKGTTASDVDEMGALGSYPQSTESDSDS
ncbi:hypothetical protein HD806DRAFT_541648 [Xylariaceae sp. AK1471]|nr:hypothetical protein HD806DRAFT_541648 [Xylariaceae sp. AK1471]